MSPQDLPQIRRILIALDASPSSLSALQAAAQLARQLGAEITGIFIEDVNLLRLADLSLAREIAYYSATFTTLDRGQVEAQLRAQAQEARRALERLADREHIRSHFHVARGLISSELLQAAGEHDLIILGKVGWSRRRHLGSTATVMVTHSDRSVLVVQQGMYLATPVTVVYDGAEPSQYALEFAWRLAAEEGGPLAVIIYAETMDAARKLQHDVSQELRPRGLGLNFRWLIAPDASRLGPLLRSMEIGMLILPTLECLDADHIAGLLNDLDVPIYLFR